MVHLSDLPERTKKFHNGEGGGKGGDEKGRGS